MKIMPKKQEGIAIQGLKAMKYINLKRGIFL